MSIESINGDISNYQKKISELTKFISSVGELKSNATNTSKLLKATSGFFLVLRHFLPLLRYGFIP